MKIGLLADTHIPLARRELPPQVWELLAGVDLVLHAGDLHILRVLDELEGLAPVVAARGNGDEALPRDPRLHRAAVIPVDGVSIGLVHWLTYPYQTLERIFGQAVDVVVFGHTHRASVETASGVLLVNPGSPTQPNKAEHRLGSVGLLEIEGGQAAARILPLG